MPVPSVNLHHLYSIKFYESCEVIFRDLNSVDKNALRTFLDSASKENAAIVPGALSVNLYTKSINISGYHLDENTYIISKYGYKEHTCLTYNCDNALITTAIEYLYHMINNVL